MEKLLAMKYFEYQQYHPRFAHEEHVRSGAAPSHCNKLVSQQKSFNSLGIRTRRLDCEHASQGNKFFGDFLVEGPGV